MKTRLLVAALTALLTLLIAMPVLASMIVYITESASTWSAGGTKWNITSTGRGGHAYQYLLYAGGNGFSWGRWGILLGEPTTTYYWWVWIPANGGPWDATVKYTISGTPSSTSINVNQNAWANQWVYLGPTNTNANGSIYMDNACVPGANCVNTYQVWWDDIMYQHP